MDELLNGSGKNDSADVFKNLGKYKSENFVGLSK